MRCVGANLLQALHVRLDAAEHKLLDEFGFSRLKLLSPHLKLKKDAHCAGPIL